MKVRTAYLCGSLILLILVCAGCNLFVPSSTPTVTLVPSSGIVNSRITIVGTGFGGTQGTGYVALDGVPASIFPGATRASQLVFRYCPRQMVSQKRSRSWSRPVTRPLGGAVSP